MTSRLSLVALLAAFVVLGCSTQDVLEALEGAPPLMLSDHRVSVPVHELQQVPLQGAFPTDICPTGDGGFAVLDGVRRTLSLHDSAGQEVERVQGAAPWGSPTRCARIQGGWLLTDPGQGETAPGAVLRLDPTGTVLSTMPMVPAPIALAVQGDVLFVAGRGGELVRCTLDGERCEPLPPPKGARRALSDLVALGNDGLLAVDPLSSVVHVLQGGEVDHSFGRFGGRVGAMRQPKSAAPAHGSIALVDSGLGTAQLFEPSGTPLGPLLSDDVLLRWEHPLAVRALGGDRFAVLDAAGPSVTLFTLTAPDIAASRAVSDLRRLRVPLPEPAGSERSRCRQCHDGFVQDGRVHEDPARFAHRVDFEPERPLPESAHLEQARLVCGSCHAPHSALPTGASDSAPPFPRIPHGDTAYLTRADRSALCVECHGDTAHGEPAAVVAGGAARGHPVGAALAAALARRPDGGPAGPRGDCLDCHVAHAAGSETLLRADDLGGTCLGCHEDYAQPTRNHPLGAAFTSGTPRPGPSARLELDSQAGIGCGTCHDVLDGRGKALMRPGARGGAVCVACHSKRKANGAHANLASRGGPSCLACHDPHGSDRAAHLPARTTGGLAGCMSCHGPKGSAFVASIAPGTRGHPVRDVGDGPRAVQSCKSCHDPHDPATPTPCADCHASQGAAAARGGHGGASCVSCHPAHSDPRPVPVSATAKNPASRPCLACHGPDARGDARRVAAYEHPRDVFQPDGSRWTALAALPLFTPQGEPAPLGENGDLTCQSCHRVHGPEPGDTLALVRRGGMQPCAACHGPDSLPLFRWYHDPERRARGLPGSSP